MGNGEWGMGNGERGIGDGRGEKFFALIFRPLTIILTLYIFEPRFWPEKAIHLGFKELTIFL